MMFSSFSPEARDAMTAAAASARRHGEERVGTQHLLVGVAADAGTVAGRILHDAGASAGVLDDAIADGRHDERLLGTLGIDAGRVQEGIRATFGDEAAAGGAQKPELTPDAARAVGQATEEARQLGSKRFGSGHLLLGLLTVGGPSTELLRALEVDPLTLRTDLLRELAA